MPNAIKSGAADELIYQIETNNMQWTTNGNIDLSTETERLGGGSVIGKRLIQQKATQKALELLGDQAWEYGYKSRTCHNHKPLKRILPEVQQHCGFVHLKLQCFRRWLQDYLMFGLIPDDMTKLKKKIDKLKTIKMIIQCLSRLEPFK